MTSEELVEAYKTIFNLFQIAAKNISVHDTINISIGGPFEFISATATSNRDNINIPDVIPFPDKTVIEVDIASIQKDEVVEIVIKARVKEDAQEGTYDINRIYRFKLPWAGDYGMSYRVNFNQWKMQNTDPV